MRRRDRVIRVGVAGFGFMGRTHIAAYLRARAAGVPVELSAIADADPRAWRSGGRRGNIAVGGEAIPRAVRCLRDAGELFDDPAINAVSICTPTDTHRALALAAMRAGKDVLVEKPLVLRSGEARELAREASRLGRVCMPAMCVRFWPGWSGLADRVRDGRLGGLGSLTIQRLGACPAWSGFYADESRSGGALYDIHIHDTDFVVHLFGVPRRVRAEGTRGHVVTRYEFARGPALVVAEGGWPAGGATPWRMRYVAEFASGTLEYDSMRDPAQTLARDGRLVAIRLDPLSGYDHEVRHFARVVAGRRLAGRARVEPVLACDGPRGAAAVLRVVEAEARSLERGDWVVVGA